MSVAKVTMGGVSSHELLSTPEAIKGGEILDETLKEMQSSGWVSYKDIPDSALVSLALSGEGFKKYGARFFKLVKQDIFFERMQKALFRATSEMAFALKDPIYILLAMSKMGVWKCGEITNTIGAKALKANLPGVVAFYLKQSNGPGFHDFIMVGKDVEKELQTHLPSYRNKVVDVLEFIEKFKSGIILDGTVLTKPMAARDVRQCREFVDHIKGLSVDKIDSQTLFSRFAKDMDQFLAQAEKLKAKMIEVLPTIPKVELSALLDKNEISICAKELGNRIPDTKWASNAKAKKIWFEGTEEQAIEIYGYLKAHCIKADEPAKTKSEKWVVIISNPNFDQIDCLPSFTHWKNKKKTEEKKSSDESSSEKDKGSALIAEMLEKSRLELEKRIPDMTWKKNTKKQAIWIEGTKEKAEEIAAFLKAHCIKAKASAFQDGDKWAVMLTNPDFSLFEKLPTFEQWKIRNL